jgi:hypothetical protein
MSTEPGSSGGRNEEAGDSAIAEVFNRFAFDSDRRRRKATKQDDTVNTTAGQKAVTWPSNEAPPPPQQALPEPPPEPTASDDDPAEQAETATYIRPYAWTGGRTRSNHVLEVETLVSTSEACQTARLERLEHHSIANLCQHPRSVAEVGALLSVPLGVARVLLGDMAELGLVTVHRTVTKDDTTSHMMLMERVLSGLRRL